LLSRDISILQWSFFHVIHFVCAQKLAADLKSLEQENELLKQKVEAGKAR